jgi:hypothetical protein
MAKKSAIEPQQQAAHQAGETVYGSKRADPKKLAIIEDRVPVDGERFEATLKLAEMPRNANQDPHPQSLRADGPSARLLPQAEDVAHRAAGIGLEGPRFPADQVELVRRSRHGE